MVNRTKLGSHGERHSGYGMAADLTVQAAYDMVGNNTSVTDGRDATATYTCDALSRLTGASQPLSTGVTPCSERKPIASASLLAHGVSPLTVTTPGRKER